MNEIIHYHGRFFSLIEENNIIHGKSLRIRSKKDGEYIPLECIPEVDGHAATVLGYWEPADVEDIRQLAKITNTMIQEKRGAAETQAAAFALNSQNEVSKHNTWIWVIALCMAPFSWGISLLLLFFLKTAKPAIKLANASIEQEEKKSEWLEAKRDAAREYLRLLAQKEQMEKRSRS